jgi:hypothetical protein
MMWLSSKSTEKAIVVDCVFRKLYVGVTATSGMSPSGTHNRRLRDIQYRPDANWAALVPTRPFFEGFPA